MSKLKHILDVRIPIEEAFPNIFKDKTGIFVTASKIHDIEGYYINQFPPEEQNRNHYDSRDGAAMQYLIMHYTVSNFPRTIETFTSNQSTNRVSAHYVITENEDNVGGGQVVQVVHDECRAWHAGVSHWKKDTNLNAISLGIEHVNKGFTINSTTNKKDWYPFDEKQIKSSGVMTKDIIREYNIPTTHILGHADIAPTRKQDPGILYPWGKLYAEYGIGAWLDKDEMDPQIIKEKYDPKEPCPNDINLSLFLKFLKSYGYDVSENLLEKTINLNKNFSIPCDVLSITNAFKSHFSANQQPELYDSPVDLTDMYWSWALNAKYCADSDIELVGAPSS